MGPLICRGLESSLSFPSLSIYIRESNLRNVDRGLVAQAHVPDDQRPRGAVYRYDPDGTLTVHEPGKIICGNGIGWTPDDQTALFTDSYRKVIPNNIVEFKRLAN